MSNQDLADRVGLTPAPCLRRVRRLEELGVITGYRADIDPEAIGQGFEVIIHADLVAKDWPTTQAFEARLAAMPQIVELRRMFGVPDYFIRARTADVAAYEHWLTTQIMADPALSRVDSRLTMKVLKRDA